MIRTIVICVVINKVVVELMNSVNETILSSKKILVQSTMKKNEKPIFVEESFNTSVDAVWKAITEIDQMRQCYFEGIPSFKPEVGFETQFNVQSRERNFIHL